MADDRVDLVKQVKEANDIVDVVGGYIALRQAGPTFKGLCPFHDDHRPSFDVDPRRQRYKCWSCGKSGDVISFVQEHDRVDFREALELLARRAGISLEKTAGFRQNPDRAAMLDLNRWADEQFQQCLRESPLAEAARHYLDERRFTGETLRRFGMGYAPGNGNWLVQRARQAGRSFELMEKVGLIARSQEGDGYYCRFRDRIIFPIRDARGQTVAFGGRILPGSPSSERGPKYYNSSETPLFTKSEHLYGIDQARQAGQAAGYLAVVEGYTDVMMAHQTGVAQVVATLGTALNARHVRHLRRFVPRVVLVFDNDEGGETGVDRALEIFVSQDVDLAIAMLPSGMDPFDLLVQQGAEPFQAALAGAVDALEFKLTRVLNSEETKSIEGRRRAVEELLRIIALAPEMTGQAGAVKRELIVTRIAQRLALREETVWARLRELRETVKRPADYSSRPEPAAPQAAPAAPHERELLQVLLAEPDLVSVAFTAVTPERIEHPGLRSLLETIYAMLEAGEPIEVDRLRERFPQLWDTIVRFQELGRLNSERPAWLERILDEFAKRQLEPEKRELQSQLHGASDHEEAKRLLAQLQKRSASAGLRG